MINSEVGGWVYQAPTRIFVCVFFVFFVLLFLYMFPKKQWIGGEVVGCDLVNLFYLFFIFKGLTILLSVANASNV